MTETFKTRVGHVIAGSVHALLDRIEDQGPEAMMEQSIRGADAVIDTGDTTSFGLEFEGGFADLIKDFDIPYYWVAGNHDSKEVREAIARSAGVTPLDDRAVRIGARDASTWKVTDSHPRSA